jgi:hypothetical protein
MDSTGTIKLLAGLGLCEHCGTLVSVSDYAADESMNADWLCRCGKKLTHTSFGYDKGTEGAKKVRWVSPDRKWTDVKPAEDFQLGKVRVIRQMSRFAY